MTIHGLRRQAEQLRQRLDGGRCEVCGPLWDQPIEFIEVEAAADEPPAEQLHKVHRGRCEACGAELPISFIEVVLPRGEEPPSADEQPT